MLYCTPPTSHEPIHQAMRDGFLACMTTPRQGNRIPLLENGKPVLHVRDNSHFGKNPPGPMEWWRWLNVKTETYGVDQCLFVTAPDVVGDAVATWNRAELWLPRIRGLGHKAALVAQDGMELRPVDFSAFDVLFIGGSTQWKLGPHARSLIQQAKAHGKWVHMGRVNWRKRLRQAAEMEVDSCDGTCMAFGPKTNYPLLQMWYAEMKEDGLVA